MGEQAGKAACTSLMPCKTPVALRNSGKELLFMRPFPVSEECSNQYKTETTNKNCILPDLFQTKLSKYRVIKNGNIPYIMIK